MDVLNTQIYVKLANLLLATILFSNAQKWDWCQPPILKNAISVLPKCWIIPLSIILTYLWRSSLFTVALAFSFKFWTEYENRCCPYQICNDFAFRVCVGLQISMHLNVASLKVSVARRYLHLMNQARDANLSSPSLSLVLPLNCLLTRGRAPARL